MAALILPSLSVNGDHMTEEQRTAVETLRHAGYAVVVFYPEEVGSADPRRVEDRLAELGNDVIDDLKD